MDWLTEPFSYDFMHRAIAVILMSSAGCAWLGVHITLRRMSFFGDALAHSTLPGVVLAHFFGWHLLLGALTSAVAAVIGVAWAGRSPKTSEDSVIGVLYTGFFALGLIGLHHTTTYQDLTHILLGNPLSVTANDLIVISGCTVVVMAALFIGHRLLTVTLIDPDYARSIGQSPTAARLLILLAASVTVVTAMAVVGLVLTVALIITPAATARLFCQRLSTTIIAAMILSMTAGIGGMLAAWHWEWPAGATIVVLLTFAFMVARIGTSFSNRQA